MSNPAVNIELTKEGARRLLAGLQTTAMIAGDSALDDASCEEGVSEFGAIDQVDRIIGQLRKKTIDPMSDFQPAESHLEAGSQQELMLKEDLRS